MSVTSVTALGAVLLIASVSSAQDAKQVDRGKGNPKGPLDDVGSLKTK